MPDIAAITAVDITARDSTQGAFQSVAAGLRGLGGDVKIFSREVIAMQAALASIAAAVGLSVFSVSSWTKETIAAASALDDLADSTGSSVAALSRLSNQAKIAGLDFGTLQGLMLKLSSGMAGVENEGSNVGRALAALGVTARDPAEALQQVAIALDGYADGIGKAALARDLFGKGGPAFLAQLKDIAHLQDVAATVTAEQAAQAEKLEQALRRLSVESTTLKNVLLSDLVPAMTRFIEGVKLARAEGLDWLDSLRVGTTYADRFVPRITELGVEISDLTKKVVDAKRYGFTDWLKEWEPALRTAQAEMRTLIALRDRMIMSNVAALGYTGDSRDQRVGNFGAGKPELNYTGGKERAAGVDEYAKALQAAQKVALEAELAFGDVGKSIDEKTSPAMKRLIELEGDSSFRAFPKTQREAIEAIYLEADAIQHLTAWIEADGDLSEKLAAAKQKANEERQRGLDQVSQELQSYLQGTDALAAQVAIIGQSELARQQLAETIAYETALRKLNDKAIESGIELSLEELTALKASHEERLRLLGEAFGKEQLVKDLAEQAAEWKRTYEQISNTITDALMRGFEGGKNWARNFFDTLKNMAATLILRPIVQAIVSPLAGGITGLVSGGVQAGGLSGTVGSVGGIGSLFGGVGGGSEALLSALGLGSGGMSIGTALGNIGTILPTLLETGSFSAAFAGMASSFAAVAPWAALAAIAVPLIIKAFDKGDAMRVGTFASNGGLGAGNPLFQGSSAFGSFGVFNDQWFSDKDMGPAMQSLLATIKGLDDAIAQAVGPALTDTIAAALQSGKSYQFGMEHTDLSASGVAGGILKDRYVSVLNAIEMGLGDMLTSFTGTGEEMAKFVLGLIGVHRALADAAAIAKVFGTQISIADIQGLARDGEDLASAFSRLSSEFTATNFVALTLGKDAATAFGSIGLASTAARENLINLSGGIDALTAKANFYYENFLTDAERLAVTQKLVAKTFDDLGLTGITTVEQFKMLVKGLDTSTEAGAKMYAALMGIAPAFLEVAKASAQATEVLLNELPRIVDGVRMFGAPQARTTTPWEQSGGGSEIAGRNTGRRGAPGAVTRDFSASIAEFVAQMRQAQEMLATLVASNPLTDAIAANGTQWEKLTAAGNALDTLTAYYDGTTKATATLSESTRDYYSSLVQMLGVIEQLKTSIAGMFGESIRTYTMSGMSPAEQYAYIAREVEALRQQLGAATDPGQINSLAQQINQEQRAAWQLLSPEQQAQVRGQYIEAATAANNLAQQRLDAAEKAATERWDKLIKGVKDALTEAASPYVTAGNTMNAAGAAMLLASRNAQTPTRTTPSSPSSPVITPRTPSDVNA